MPTNSLIGYQTQFAIFNGTSYVAVAEVTNVTPAQYSRDAIEATHNASPNAAREFIPGLIDAGELTLSINYIPAVADTIIAAMRAGLGQFRVTFPNGVTCTFSGVITGYSPEAPLDDKMAATVTIKASGLPVWA